MVHHLKLKFHELILPFSTNLFPEPNTAKNDLGENHDPSQLEVFFFGSQCHDLPLKCVFLPRKSAFSKAFFIHTFSGYWHGLARSFRKWRKSVKLVGNPTPTTGPSPGRLGLYLASSPLGAFFPHVLRIQAILKK